MQTYLVEQMEGDDVISVRIVNAPSPFKAAAMSTNRHVTLRTWEKDWIRVTDENRGHIFAYCFVSDGDSDTGGHGPRKAPNKSRKAQKADQRAE
ncbi:MULTISPECIES: hypothetical protein [unclassified Mesorhizobium]|uniref:hypothetical protein n=1 Tax=unclassified Mesorhizobium TaxID=325217 RepID=UPI00163B8B45|nr:MULTISPECIES: hypothetical protein [unclassified Mesorhizobium]